jgi:hypothetical protein
MAYGDLATLSDMQSKQAQFMGNDAAKIADPYGYQRRNAAADKFDTLLSNPGSMESSPFFKYLSDRAMAATRAGNAAGGFRNSGRGLMALQESAQGAATKAFFPLAELYGKASGALNPLSPAAAGIALSGSNRSQDYSQMGEAARSLAQRQAGTNAGATPWWMQGAMPAAPLSTDPYRDWYNSQQTGLPTGGNYSGDVGRPLTDYGGGTSYAGDGMDYTLGGGYSGEY